MNERAKKCKGRVRGERHPKAKLTDHDVWLVLELRKCGLGYKRISQKMDNAPIRTIRQICNNQRRRVLSPEELAGCS